MQFVTLLALLTLMGSSPKVAAVKFRLLGFDIDAVQAAAPHHQSPRPFGQHVVPDAGHHVGQPAPPPVVQGLAAHGAHPTTPLTGPSASSDHATPHLPSIHQGPVLAPSSSTTHQTLPNVAADASGSSLPHKPRGRGHSGVLPISTSSTVVTYARPPRKTAAENRRNSYARKRLSDKGFTEEMWPDNLKKVRNQREAAADPVADVLSPGPTRLYDFSQGVPDDHRAKQAAASRLYRARNPGKNLEAVKKYRTKKRQEKQAEGSTPSSGASAPPGENVASVHTSGADEPGGP